MVLSGVHKVCMMGKNSLGVVIPVNIRKILNIKQGDYIKIDWLEVMKIPKEEVKNNKKKENKEEELPKFEDE